MFKKGKGGVKIVYKKMVFFFKVGGYETYDNIIFKFMFINSLFCSFISVEVKINSIVIEIIC